MSNTKDSKGGYVIVALITAGIVYSCTRQDERPTAAATPTVSSVVPAMPVSAQASEAVIQPSIPAVARLYDSVEGTTYYYGAAVSEEARKSGVRAPRMLAFWYLGRNAKGRDLIQGVYNGVGGEVAACMRPCKVIHYEGGSTLGFDEGSVIGGAFADAQRGFLKKHQTMRPAATPLPPPPPLPSPPPSLPAPPPSKAADLEITREKSGNSVDPN